MAVPAASWGRPGGVRGRPGASRGRPGASRGVGASQRVPGRPGASLGVPGAPPDTCPRGAPGRPRDTCPGAPPGRPGTPPGRPGTPFSAVSAWRLRFRNPCRLVFSATVVHFHQDVVLGSNPFFVNFWLPQAPLRRDSIGLCRNVATAEFVRSSSSACYSRENAFASLKQFHRRAPIGIFRKVKTTISCNVFLRFFRILISGAIVLLQNLLRFIMLHIVLVSAPNSSQFKLWGIFVCAEGFGRNTKILICFFAPGLHPCPMPYASFYGCCEQYHIYLNPYSSCGPRPSPLYSFYILWPKAGLSILHPVARVLVIESGSRFLVIGFWL